MKIKQDGQYLSVILDNENQFYMTGYRILKKQEDKGLLPCGRILFNGNIKLLYPINKLTPLSYDISCWHGEQVLPNIISILSIFKMLSENGFLQPETILPELQYMYMDKSVGRIFLIALPVNKKTDPGESAQWLSALKKSLISLIEYSPGRDEPELIHLKNNIIREASSLAMLCNAVSLYGKDSQKRDPVQEDGIKENVSQSLSMKLVLVGDSRSFSLDITKDEFVIGKLKNSVDGVIDFTPTISRRHCMIVKDNDKFYIRDLGSANHTYVNGVMIPPGQSISIKANDKIRMAELDFLVCLV